MSQLVMKTGRPRHSTDPELRARRIAAVRDYKVLRAPLANVAAFYGVHPATLIRWVSQVRNYTGRDADHLRAQIRVVDSLHNPDLHDDGAGGDDASED